MSISSSTPGIVATMGSSSKFHGEAKVSVTNITNKPIKTNNITLHFMVYNECLSDSY
ncbi:MAG: hypothetical protein Sylvanvirus30_8 [Sylvanvirus sp.]|uniref:Uncharacterized protein n=1 Tax=Sylvanvirus sp. TaxID=2487774 RepID=A0A3G5AJ20_9VIRU|nr:MAG: hypothetical protein Sylvanvirus30_8 [Sylvanvirus sp.]